MRVPQPMRVESGRRRDYSMEGIGSRENEERRLNLGRRDSREYHA